MPDEDYELAESVERSSTAVIVAVSLIAVLMVYSGIVGFIGGALQIGEGVAVIAFAVLVNVGLVAYQVSAGKRINTLCKRPYI